MQSKDRVELNRKEMDKIQKDKHHVSSPALLRWQPTAAHSSKRGTSTTTLPDELIEEILSKSPIKSVVRFKSVSKSWRSIISNPRFSRIHRIRRSQLPENQNTFLLWSPQQHLGARIFLLRLECGKYLRTESVLESPSQIFVVPLSSWNGLILLRADRKNHAYDRQYMLWNPSMRKHIVIRAPSPENHPHPRLHHFYHDSTTADDRIVFVYKNCYAVYSCNDGSWSGMKKFPCELRQRGGPVAVDGCFYTLRGGGTVCFDARDRKLHELRQLPNDVLKRVCLTPPSLNGSLMDYLSTPQIWEVGKWVVEADLGLVPSICSRDKDNV